MLGGQTLAAKEGLRGFGILSLEPGEALRGNCLWRNVGEKGGPFRSSFEGFLQFGILIASVEL